jgi:hypothetical protein
MTEHTSPHATGRLSRPLYVLAFAGALLFLYLRTFLLPATPFLAISDQNLFFARAVRMLHGQLPYRDFFEFVTPGIEIIYAAAFRVFGVHAWVMQAWGIAIGLALCCVITRIAARILRGPLVLLPALLFLVFDFSSALSLTHHWYSTFATLCAVSVLMAGADLRRIFAAGLLCGVAALFTQTQGTLTLLAVAAYLVWCKRSEPQAPGILTQLATLLLPFTLILSLVLGYSIHRAGFRTVFSDIVAFPPRFMSSEVNSPRTYLHQLPPVHAPGDLLRVVPYLFIYAVIPYAYFIGLYQIHRKRSTLPAVLQQRLVLLNLVGLALFVAIAYGPRFFRLCTVAAPAILVCVWLLSEQTRAHRFARTLLWSTAIFFALLLPFHRQTEWHATLDLPVGRTAFSDAAMFHNFQWLAQRTRPFDPFFNSSSHSLYLDLRNPTPLEFISYDDFTRPEWVAAAIQSLQRDPPRYIVLQPESEYPAGPHNHATPFRQYVHDNYRLVETSYFDDSHQAQEEFWEFGSRRLPEDVTAASP